MAQGYTFRVTLGQVGPTADPTFARAPVAVRRALLRQIVAWVLDLKDAELAAGLDKDGVEMAPLSQYTIDHRHSEMGPADPNAPPLTPAHGLSRTRALLDGRARVGRDDAEFFWRSDPISGGSWGKILGYHREGKGRLPVRDVIGVSTNILYAVRTLARAWWARYRTSGRVPDLVDRVGPQPPDPAPAFVVRTVKGYKPQFPELAVPKNPKRVSQIEVNGKIYTLGASVNGNGSAASVRRGIANGSFSGWRKHDHSAPPRPPGGLPPGPGPGPGPKPPRPPVELPEPTRPVAALTGDQLAARLGIKPPAPGPAPPPNPAPPRFLPGKPIADRIAQWKDGDKKLAAIKAARDKADADVRDVMRERADLSLKVMDAEKRIDARLDELKKQARGGKIDEGDRVLFFARKEIRDLEARRGTLYLVIDERRRELRGELRKVLSVGPKTTPLGFHADRKEFDLRGVPLDPVSRDLRTRADDGLSWLNDVFADLENHTAFPRIKLGQIPTSGQYWTRSHQDSDYIALEAADGVETAVHEWGHALELHATAGGETLMQRSLEFLAHRCGSEAPVQLNKVLPGTKYTDSEFGRKDRFDQAFSLGSAYYIGKPYIDRNGKHFGTEVLSMGLQMLYQDPVRFVEKDPEFCKFILGMASGALR